MRKLLSAVMILLCIKGHTQQNTNDFFQSIRKQEIKLIAFFNQMPKGGDLHHHFAGSTYAEPMIEKAIKEDFYLNKETFAVSKSNPGSAEWVRFSEIINNGQLDAMKIKILQTWSVKDYDPSRYPSDKLFFESFLKFWPLMDNYFVPGLLELKNRALKENLSYIETQLTTPINAPDVSEWYKLDDEIRAASSKQQEEKLNDLFSQLYESILKKGAVERADSFNLFFLKKLHDSLRIDEPGFKMRYQNYVLRFMNPVDLFNHLTIAFLSADRSDLIAGVNIVSPEDGDVSMKDYELHMKMYRFFHQKFPNVKYSMHAGELTLGLVMPEELTWHINAAVRIAGAKRIGHGIDLAHEKNPFELLRYMKKNDVAIEINPESNSFILKIDEKNHPFPLYFNYGVPIVIGSDDAGILRTNLTNQFVILAKRYPFLTYNDFKKFVFNSIDYSFIKNPAVKNEVRTDLENRFKTFEENIKKESALLRN
jgi:adenosine deaminase